MKVIRLRDGFSTREAKVAELECNQLVALNCPYLATVRKVALKCDAMELVVDVCQGSVGTLLRKLGRHALGASEGTIWRVLVEAGAGLWHLALRRRYHGCLTVNNIMMGPHKHFVLTDFGLPPLLRPDTSLECMDCATDLPSPRCDMWALGCVAYQMCTLQPPFGKGVAGMRAMLVGNFAPVSDVYSVELRRMVNLLLTKDRCHRITLEKFLVDPVVLCKAEEMGVVFDAEDRLRGRWSKMRSAWVLAVARAVGASASHRV